MIFTSFIYAYFFAIVFVLYWALQNKSWQNALLLLASYVFYGWIHPWFCILIAISTVADYFICRALREKPQHSKLWFVLSLVVNLGMLGFFKYFNFFADNVHSVLSTMGLDVSPIALQIFLPVGISFYTFQTLSYTIDIYRGELEPRKNFIDFAVFVSFFPQLVAGPIERAKRFLPQVENNRKFALENFTEGIPLIIVGYFKKMVVADNIALYVDKVFMLQEPSAALLFAGTAAFALQILADFSGYTDIARGMAKLLGFNLVLNFNAPYLAISPSDFWRRWHISFSSWIRDYIYISLGGSRVKTSVKFAWVLLVTLGLSGLWHGAAWNFIVWGVFHAALVFIYHKLGFAGHWKPKTWYTYGFSWFVMMLLTLVGWSIFRAPSMEWLLNAVFANNFWSGTVAQVDSALVILSYVLVYTVPMVLIHVVQYLPKRYALLKTTFYAVLLVATILLFREYANDFIYFQF